MAAPSTCRGARPGRSSSSSTFTSNTASNAGAVGGLFNELDVYNSLFTGNKAAGNGANNNDPDEMLGDEQRAERDRVGR